MSLTRRSVAKVIDNLDQLLKKAHWQTIYDECFDSFPPKRFNQMEEAVDFFEGARSFYIGKQKNYKETVECCLKLTRLYQRIDIFSLADKAYKDAAYYALKVDKDYRADLVFQIGRLCPDIGKVNQSIKFLAEALRLYEEAGDVLKQIETLWLLAVQIRQSGDYLESGDRIRMAQRRYKIQKPDLALQAYIKNAEVHLQWYKGNLSQALESAKDLKEFADNNTITIQQVYARVLLGNINQALGGYAKAQLWYDDAKKTAEGGGFISFLLWIDLQIVWLKILEGQGFFDDETQALLDKTRAVIDDYGLRMSLNVFEAGFKANTNLFYEAEELLEKPFKFYKRSGDGVAVCAIGLYLAYIYLCTARIQMASSYLKDGLQWLSDRDVDYFPLWWHPKIVSELCVYAITENIHPNLAYRILRRVSEASPEVLPKLRTDKTSFVWEYADNILSRFVSNGSFSEIRHLEGSPIRKEIENLLGQGSLSRDKFRDLVRRLRTSKKRMTDNYTIVAVFGLYVTHHTGSQIAQKLSLSPKTVRNYITDVYKTFFAEGEDNCSGPGARKRRREKLLQIAQKEGFVENT